MKKITLFAFAVVALSLASCKKDRTCECTYTQSGTTNVTSNTENITYTKVRKSDAKYFCDKVTNTNTYTSSGGSSTGTSTSDCKLK